VASNEKHNQEDKPMITKIATVGVYVDNQQKAVQFWTEQVGFVVHRSTPMTPEASWIEIGPEGAESALVIYPKTMMPNWEKLKPSIVFQCEQIDVLFDRMSKNGVVFLEEPQRQPWGAYARFQDHDGNEFLLKEG
jgi:lactoylglutathione lyase